MTSEVGRRAFLRASAVAAPAALLTAGCTTGAEPHALPGDGTSAGDARRGAPAELRVDVKAFGAVGDGEADDTDAVITASRAVLDERVNDGQVTRELFFPPGVYRVTRPDCLLDATDGTQVRGLTIRGMGKRTSEILFDSQAGDSRDHFANNLMTAANGVRALRISSMSFRSTNPAQSWMYCWSRDADDSDYAQPKYGAGNNQDFLLHDVEWRGPWRRGIGLDGDQQSNLNSEWAFDNCHVSNSGSFEDAFLHSGMTPEHEQQDQFLNFWFRNCKFEYAYGTLLRLERGGFVTVIGGSWIAGIDSDRPATMFELGGEEHYDAVQNLVVVGTRFELRGPDVRLLDCGWAGRSAHLSFLNVSDAAHAFKDWAKDSTPVILRARGDAIATVKFTNSELMGAHRVVGSPAQGRVVYDACNFTTVPQGGVGEDAFLRFDGSPARYRFVDCYGVDDSAG